MENLLEEIDNVVSLEVAKQLKENGFNKPTYYYYLDRDLHFSKKGLKRVKMGKRRMNHNRYDECVYSAPTPDELKGFKIKNK